MTTARAKSHKHFQLDAAKLRLAQRMLRADTETETIERALDSVIAEHERNRLTTEANNRFVTSGIDVKDAYGTLEK
jgi:ribonuclease HII